MHTLQSFFGQQSLVIFVAQMVVSPMLLMTDSQHGVLLPDAQRLKTTTTTSSSKTVVSLSSTYNIL
eukprot:scaffold5079_cov169-Amphora_coffeaeformis.AAC.10